MSVADPISSRPSGWSRALRSNGLTRRDRAAGPGRPSGPAFDVSEPPQPRYLRSPVSVGRLLVAALVVTLASIGLANSDNSAFATSFAKVLASAPHWLITSITGVAQLGFFVPSILGFVGLIVSRRFARVGRMMLAAVLSIAAMVLVAHVLGTSKFSLFPGHGHHGAAGTKPPAGGPHHEALYGVGSMFPTVMDIGVLAAWWFADAGHWANRWRRVAALILLAAVLGSLGVHQTRPLVLVVAFATAFGASQLVDVIIGRPNRRPTAEQVGNTLTSLGYGVTAVERFGGFTGFDGYLVRCAEQRLLFVKILTRESWAGLVPSRIYRAARFREGGDQPAFRSLRAGVEHEALSALKALADGVPTARVADIAECGPGGMLIAFESKPWVPLAELPVERLDDNILRGIWRVVAALQRGHIVHRRLDSISLLVDEDDAVELVGFGAAHLGVVGPELSTDIAEALALTGAMFGPSDAVAAAVDALGTEPVAQALPRLQPLALTRSTRDLVKAKGGLDPIREAVQSATGTADVPLVELHRVKPRTVVTIVMAAVVMWTLIPQVAGLGSVWTELGDANWWFAASVLVLSAITYVAAAVALDGSVTEDLPLVPNVGAQFATAFVAVAAPGGALALTGRFLQKRGIDGASAAAAVGVDTVAGAIVHVLLTAVFISFAGTSGLKSFSLPSGGVIAIVVAVVVALIGVALIVPWTRAALAEHVMPATRRSMASMSELVRRPVKMVELFGGSFVLTMANVLALAAAVAAFGGGPSFTSIALVYLVGMGLSSVAPTPGGVGAVEAVLAGGLTSAGMQSSVALAAVLWFRLATFWLPLIPGWFAFTGLQRSGDL